MEKLRVGFIGLGTMGGRLATEMAPICDLAVYDVEQKAMTPFSTSSSLAKSAAEVGRDADVVGICVRNDAEVDECVDALLPAMRSGAVLMIHSTVDPATVHSAAERAMEFGVNVIDTPVTRTDLGATGPFVLTMTGGDEEVVERCRPLLNAYSTDTLHVGPLGSAMALKIINNLVSLVEIAVTEEAVRLAELSSVSLDHLKTVMTSNGVLSRSAWAISLTRQRARTDPAERQRLASQAGNCEKDLALAATLAKNVNTSGAIATFVQSRIRFAMTNGLE